MIRLLVLSTIAITGCSTITSLKGSIRPAYYDVDVTHVSHITQHTSGHEFTRYGYNVVNVGAHWDTSSGVYLDIAEGIVLEPCGYWQDSHVPSCGGLAGGMRETFTGTIGYKFWSK